MRVLGIRMTPQNIGVRFFAGATKTPWIQPSRSSALAYALRSKWVPKKQAPVITPPAPAMIYEDCLSSDRDGKAPRIHALNAVHFLDDVLHVIDGIVVGQLAA